MKKTINVTYKFEIEHEHQNHLDHLIQELTKGPIISLAGAGEASNGMTYIYRCQIIGEGTVIE